MLVVAAVLPAAWQVPAPRLALAVWVARRVAPVQSLMQVLQVQVVQALRLVQVVRQVVQAVRPVQALPVARLVRVQLVAWPAQVV